jgi:cytochrome b6-f complex iron-sulfur subunit
MHFEGPAPRPLERCSISLSPDGQLLIDKSKKFLWEKGDWDKPESVLKV